MSTLIKWFIAFLMVVAGLVQGCGTRKSDVNIHKSSEVVREADNTVTKEETKSEVEKKSTEEEKSDKVDEKQEQKITELYDENGRLKSRITELLNSKSTDKSTKAKQSSETLKTSQIKTVNNYITKEVRINTKEKIKSTEQSNGNLYLMIGLVLIVGMLLYFVYKRLSK